ncbi:hypothetical protein GJV85_08795 [Sulfurimonas aquatica]|uniref:Uncharacterized protein n=1 Tax=Sulfurimonas aquatica TaxID=2672570 RepID=A0A975B134_9BACT|nr:hypothetical protein [Sulfurimonas aquatica]QSZ42205.1 hypothetical protein GJV85_08795 [Sulfurimonas aquatica]
MKAQQELKMILEDLSPDNIGETTANNLNELFSVFNDAYILRSKNGKYELKEIEEIYEKCFVILKREYSRKFISCMATTMMFQEKEE